MKRMVSIWILVALACSGCRSTSRVESAKATYDALLKMDSGYGDIRWGMRSDDLRSISEEMAIAGSSMTSTGRVDVYEGRKGGAWYKCFFYNDRLYRIMTQQPGGMPDIKRVVSKGDLEVASGNDLYMGYLTIFGNRATASVMEADDGVLIDCVWTGAEDQNAVRAVRSYGLPVR